MDLQKAFLKASVSDADAPDITSFDQKDIAEKIKMALDFGKRTNGRECIALDIIKYV